ncbi:response regulator transcription factor [Sunxiuqinia elliptica]|uniref:DNA-binding response regulator, OmpR family, contains REC and winged-helix (WHTH) domain n=1 Tax=Sunxiuqinia elliptica TaxID=655355 RepID=A0A1I2F4G9_9BACT|nr:response regulator transcription factor [Sunxiuqinia elliptica]SFF00314.1 DNA-binding response regulator, OmpR family, contains REC and winged-helix (wHTH) domain [Sunxiuqinia elliptica]
MELTGKKILLVEDDKTLNFIIRDNLEEAGYEVQAAEDGVQAFDTFSKHAFDLCLLDVMLPKLDGFSLAKKIREKNQSIPILFLTAKAMTEDKINGFTIGGDDYITKPFSMEELLLRIKVFLKRSHTDAIESEELNRCKIGQFDFLFDNLTLQNGDEKRTLTYKEAELLKYFCENSNSVLSRSDILKNVWGSDDYYLGRSLDVFISRLRKYLKSDPSIKIINLHGIGFRFNASVEKV